MTAAADTLLTQLELAERWRLSPRTLEQWRWQGQGPRFLKLGRRVRYRLSDIEAHEAARWCTSTLGPEVPEVAR